jgi:hypothetical protein
VERAGAKGTGAVNRKQLLEWAVTIAGVVLAAIWLFLVLTGTGPVPKWLPPAAVLLVAVAAAMP